MPFQIELRYSDFLCLLEDIILVFRTVVAVEKLLEVEWFVASSIIFLLYCAYVGDVFTVIKFLGNAMDEQIVIVKLSQRVISLNPLTFSDPNDSDPFCWSWAVSLQIKSHLISHTIIFVLI